MNPFDLQFLVEDRTQVVVVGAFRGGQGDYRRRPLCIICFGGRSVNQRAARAVRSQHQLLLVRGAHQMLGRGTQLI